MDLRISADIAGLRQGLQSEKRRLARVTRRVVNAAAYQALDDVRAEMDRFDRPTPFVKRGPYVIPGMDKDEFAGARARIDWREFAAKSIPAQKILRAQIEGGQRRLKRFERAMGLPSNRVAVPGRHAEIDKYGNLSGPFIIKILSALRLFGEQGYKANRRVGAKLRKNQSEYFMIRVGSEDKKLPPGVYRVAREMGGAPLLVIAFVRAANYRARFFPGRVVAESVNRNIGTLWQQGLSGTLPFRRGG